MQPSTPVNSSCSASTKKGSALRSAKEVDKHQGPLRRTEAATRFKMTTASVLGKKMVRYCVLRAYALSSHLDRFLD